MFCLEYFFRYIKKALQKSIINKKNLNKQVNEIVLPIVFAYVDGLIIIAENKNDLAEFLENAEHELHKNELTINYTKSNIMIRDPSSRTILETGTKTK